MTTLGAMPRVSDSTAAAANPGCFASARSAKRASRRIVSIRPAMMRAAPLWLRRRRLRGVHLQRLRLDRIELLPLQQLIDRRHLRLGRRVELTEAIVERVRERPVYRVRLL